MPFHRSWYKANPLRLVNHRISPDDQISWIAVSACGFSVDLDSNRVVCGVTHDRVDGEWHLTVAAAVRGALGQTDHYEVRCGKIKWIWAEILMASPRSRSRLIDVSALVKISVLDPIRVRASRGSCSAIAVLSNIWQDSTISDPTSRTCEWGIRFWFWFLNGAGQSVFPQCHGCSFTR